MARHHPVGMVAGFYTAEVVAALGHLHANDILYADLKPENLVTPF